MKTIGLLGGMSWQSTVEYYRFINQGVQARLGGQHSAQILLYSVDFAEIEAYQMAGEWDAAAEVLIAGAKRLKAGGADAYLLCTNTMHKLAPQLEAAVDLPLIHIADPTAQAINAAGIRKIGLLGTRFTMEEGFYRGRLAAAHGLEVITPDEADRAEVHRIIYEELVLGTVREPSRAAYQNVIGRLAGQGAEGVILGCTEIMLLVRPEDSLIPTFDTTQLHAKAAINFLLADS